MPLEVVGVTHRYGRRPPVLTDVSLVIEPDVSMALTGPSGSGKTTLLSILGLLLRPTEGAVGLDGRTVAWRRASALRMREFGWVFQGTNVLGQRSAIDNVATGVLVRGMAVREARAAAAEALEAVGMGAFASRRTRTLSGGEVQRVCIARALVARPRFILADEPTGHLDSATTEVVVDALIRNRPPGSSIVVATHDPRVAQRCDRIVRLRDGVVEPEE